MSDLAMPKEKRWILRTKKEAIVPVLSSNLKRLYMLLSFVENREAVKWKCVSLWNWAVKLRRSCRHLHVYMLPLDFLYLLALEPGKARFFFIIKIKVKEKKKCLNLFKIMLIWTCILLALDIFFYNNNNVNFVK